MPEPRSLNPQERAAACRQDETSGEEKIERAVDAARTGDDERDHRPAHSGPGAWLADAFDPTENRKRKERGGHEPQDHRRKERHDGQGTSASGGGNPPTKWRENGQDQQATSQPGQPVTSSEMRVHGVRRWLSRWHWSLAVHRQGEVFIARTPKNKDYRLTAEYVSSQLVRNHENTHVERNHAAAT